MKNTKNTLFYTHLVDLGDDEHVTKVVRDTKKACELLESGFEYIITTPDDLIIFKKRKYGMHPKLRGVRLNPNSGGEFSRISSLL